MTGQRLESDASRDTPGGRVDWGIQHSSNPLGPCPSFLSLLTLLGVEDSPSSYSDLDIADDPPVTRQRE